MFKQKSIKIYFTVKSKNTIIRYKKKIDQKMSLLFKYIYEIEANTVCT